MPDNGLALLAACLRDAGHEVQIWDPGTVSTLRDCLTPEHRRRARFLLAKRRRADLDEESSLELSALEEMRQLGLRRLYQVMATRLTERLRQERFDVLGLKLWFGPGLTAGLQLAEQVGRVHQHLRIYAGGPMATLAPDLVLQRAPVLRGVCVGEGEEAIVAIADASLAGREPSGVPNLRLRSDHQRSTARSRGFSFAHAPSPCYSDEVYPSVASGDKAPVFYVEDSRGCPRRCWFCGHALFNGPGVRVRNASSVVDEMDGHHRDFKARAFRLTGSSTPEHQYGQIASLLRERRRDYLYSGFAHIESWSAAAFQPLRRSGLTSVFVGIETGSERLLREVMGKRRDPTRLFERVTACLDQGIFVCASIIFPSPGETAETEKETFALLCRLLEGRPHCAVPIQPAFPQPGSRWGDNMARYGFSGNREAVLEDMVNRRISRLVPSHLVKPLPYQLDGVPFADLAARSSEFARRLAERGILTGISDETVLLAQAADREVTEFARETGEIFASADSDRLADIIRSMRAGHAREMEVPA